MNKEKLTGLIKSLFDKDWKIAVAASDELAKHSDPLVIKALIEVLDGDSATALNAAALALREIKDNSAVEPLLRSIKKTANKNNRSTMVYALEKLDCSNHFHEIFKLALFGKKIDICMAALNILDEQGFYLDSEDIRWARKLLEENRDRINDQDLYTALNDILTSLEEE